MALKKYSPRVPREYQEIEYLKCNGTQYIDTGLVGSDLSNCEIEAIIKNETTDTTAYNFNGAFLSGSTAQFGLVATSSTECRATINFGFVSAIGITNLALSQYHTFYIKNGLQKVDGVTKDTLDFGTLNGQKFLLFARTNSSDSNITNCPAMSLKAFSVKSNGSFVRNMIPVRRISDGELGLYDTANNVFYTNQGTNSFIAGSDVDNWKDIPYRRYETATDVVTSLPVTVYGDGETDISLLLKGNTETSGTPSPQNPVTISGVGNETANILDDDSLNIGYWISSTGNLQSNQSYGAITGHIPVADTSYTIFKHGDTTPFSFSFCWYTENDTFISRTHFTGNNTSTANTVEVPNNAAYFIFQVASGQGSSSTITMDIIKDYKLMLNLGSTALPYDEYGYKISILKDLQPLTPMYFSQQLFKIGDTTDDYSSSGTATYNMGKLILTGNETWSRTSTGKMYSSNAFNDVPNYNHALAITTMCTHYTCIENAANTGTLNVNQMCLYGHATAINTKEIYIYPENYATAADFVAFLQQEYANGTPVTVWYILATPTTETVTAPSIPTTGGEVTLDIDTTVKPSELDLTYHGWHEHQPLKRENGAWV